MAEPADGNYATTPAQAMGAILMAWDDSAGEYRPVYRETNGSLKTSATVATGDAPTTGTITSVSDTNASTTILALNASRKGATIFNDSTAILYLALSDTTASTTVYTVQLAPSAYYELPACDGGCYTGKIVGIWASDASGAARITEFT